MLIDQQNQFSSNQPITALGSTPSTNVIDLGVARDIGGAVTDHLAFLCHVAVAFTSGGAGTLRVQFQTSPDNSTWSTIAQSDDIALATLVAGYKFLPNEIPGSTSRYVRLNFVVGTAAMTAGQVTAAIVPALDVAPVYARGYTA